VALALLAAAAAGALPVFRALLWRSELHPVLRGRLLAEELGCKSCHVPYAAVEIPNPGSRWGTVPRFGAGNAFMYAPDRETIEEFIRFGAPRDWLDDAAIRERLAGQHLRMPAYGYLSDGEVSDLAAWVGAVEGVGRAGGDEAAAGRELARAHGCLSCHGVEGSGGHPNPRSLGGFVPGFVGRNFGDLVSGEDEFREWVLDGTSSRLAANPLVRWFWSRQQIAMPAYRGELSDDEVADLWRWVTALRHHPPRDPSPLPSPATGEGAAAQPRDPSPLPSPATGEGAAAQPRDPSPLPSPATGEGAAAQPRDPSPLPSPATGEGATAQPRDPSPLPSPATGEGAAAQPRDPSPLPSPATGEGAAAQPALGARPSPSLPAALLQGGRGTPQPGVRLCAPRDVP
jgi:cytochrome c553